MNLDNYIDLSEFSISELSVILEYLESTRLNTVEDMYDEVYTEINNQLNESLGV